MNSRRLVSIIKVLIFSTIIGTPIFFIEQSVYPAIISKTAFFQSLVEAIFFLWLVLVIYDKRFRPRKTKVFIGLCAFLAVLALTSALGVDPSRSFWSTYERMMGVVAFLHLGLLSVVISSLRREIPWKKLLYASLGTAVFISILAILQTKVPHLLFDENLTTPGSRPGATLDNPAFLAGYLLPNFFIGLFLLMSRYSRRSEITPDTYSGWPPRKILLNLALLIAILLIADVIFLTQTRGAVLGLALGIFVLIFLFALRPPDVKQGVLMKRSIYVPFLIVAIVASSVFWFTRGSSFWSAVPGTSRFRNLSLTSADLQPRLIALRAASHGFFEKPVLGWGWDNFNIVFNKYYEPRALELQYVETRFDKPHNFLAEYLVAGGLLLFFAFIILLIFFIVEARRFPNRLFGQITVAALVAYVVQNLFIFDTLGPALMFFLLLGIIDGGYDSGQEKDVVQKDSKPNKERAPLVSSAILGLAAAASLVVIYFVNVLTVSAANYQFLAFSDFENGKVKQGISNFEEAVATWSPYRWNFIRDYALQMADAYFYNPGVIPDESVIRAVGFMEKAVSEHPRDAFNHYLLADIYNEVAGIDREKFLAAAEKESQVALELSPNRQEVYFYLAKTKSLEGDNKAALEILKNTLALDPLVPDAHFYYGLLALANNDPATGYREIQEAVKLGRGWKNYYEPRVVAGFFADAGHLDEAIDLYKLTLSMEPGDLETEIKLGAAYFLKNDTENARLFLSEARKKFDFKNSSSYGEFKPILDQLGIQ